jgi:nitrogen fixation protein NifB
MIQGVNDHHILDVVKKVKELGVFTSNIMPLIPVQGSVFEDLPPTNLKKLAEIRQECGEYLQQMTHCKQCRADAIGLLDQDCSDLFIEGRKKCSCRCQEAG